MLVMPSIKANFALALRRILTEEGTGCDTFGAGELEAALRTGVAPERISLNGSTKNRELIERAVAAGVRLTLDSVAELETVREVARSLGTVAQVRLRTRPWLEIEQPTELLAEPLSIQLATQRYKPGIPTEQLLAISRQTIEAPEIDVRGVMAHIGRQGRDPAIWAELARWVAELTGELGELWGGWRPREIDLGGGYPVPRDPFGGAMRDEDRPMAPGIEEYAEAITSSLRDGLARAGVDAAGIQLEVEPGPKPLRQHRHPPRPGAACQGAVRAGAAALGRDRHLGDLPRRRRLRAQPLAGSGRQPRRPAAHPDGRPGRDQLQPRRDRRRRRAARGRDRRPDRLPRHRRLPGRQRLQLQRPSPAGHRARQRRRCRGDQARRDHRRRLRPRPDPGAPRPRRAEPGARARPRLGLQRRPRPLARVLLRPARDPGDAARRGRGRGGRSDHGTRRQPRPGRGSRSRRRPGARAAAVPATGRPAGRRASFTSPGPGTSRCGSRAPPTPTRRWSPPGSRSDPSRSSSPSRATGTAPAASTRSTPTERRSRSSNDREPRGDHGHRADRPGGARRHLDPRARARRRQLLRLARRRRARSSRSSSAARSVARSRSAART